MIIMVVNRLKDRFNISSCDPFRIEMIKCLGSHISTQSKL